MSETMVVMIRETYLEQVQAMCRLLYPVHINIDYIPTNFVAHGESLYYIDFECNDYMEQWDFEHWANQVLVKIAAISAICEGTFIMKSAI